MRSFRRAQVDVINSLPVKVGATTSQQVEKLSAQVVKVMPLLRTFFDEMAGHEIPLDALTDIVAFHLPLKTEFKLQLLAEEDPGVRADLLLTNYSWTEPPEGEHGRYPTDFTREVSLRRTGVVVICCMKSESWPSSSGQSTKCQWFGIRP